MREAGEKPSKEVGKRVRVRAYKPKVIYIVFKKMWII
jgi:hypothetical protein